MPIFRRKAKEPATLEKVAPPAMELPSGELIERSVKATLLLGTDKLAGRLYMTNRRLLFEADKGEARYMSVPYDEMREAGLYRWHHAPMGRSSLNQCLCAVTTKGEQVWWDFGEHEEREWLPLVQEHVASETTQTEEQPAEEEHWRPR
jgi:hypothetical protein